MGEWPSSKKKVVPKPQNKFASLVGMVKKKETESIKKFLDVFLSETSVMKAS
jgi:hypothetical protein